MSNELSIPGFTSHRGNKGSHVDPSFIAEVLRQKNIDAYLRIPKWQVFAIIQFAYRIKRINYTGVLATGQMRTSDQVARKKRTNRNMFYQALDALSGQL